MRNSREELGEGKEYNQNIKNVKYMYVKKKNVNKNQ